MAGVTPARSKQYFPNSTGAPLTGGLIYTYYAGTTSLADTWQDKNLTTANTNPIVLNARGECSIWLSSALSYKFVVKDSSGVTIYTEDNVMGTGDTVAGVSDITVDRFSGTGAQTAFTLSVTPANGENCTEVYVGGVYIQKNAYSVSGATLTFAVAPASGTNNIEVNTIQYTDYTAAATSVAASASAASTSATAAATSATSAASSATAAAASATASDASADAAAASEAGAAAIVLGDFTAAGSGAVARTFLSKARDFVCILDYIPVAEHAAILARTSTYDCYADIIEAINSVTYPTQGTFYKPAPAIYFPIGKYLVNSTIDLKKTVRLYGENSGLQPGIGTELKFPAGVDGIVVNHYNTLAEDTEAVPTTSAAGTVIDGLRIIGGGGATAHGVWLRARALVKNVYVEGFSGNGVHIPVTAGAGGINEGNANNFRLEGGSCVSNTGHGVFVDGADANAGWVAAWDCTSNGGWGFFDSSFLGNTYVACHTDANTLGGYKSDNINARNLFLNCYSEGGQPTNSVVNPSMVIGGLHSPGFGVSDPWIENSGGLKAPSLAVKSTDQLCTIGIGQGAAVNDVMSISVSGGDPWTLQHATGRAYWDWANSGNQFFTFYDKTDASVANGFARDVSGIYTDGPPVGLGFGYLDGGMRVRATSTVVPSSGSALQGDIVFNGSPSAGGFIGWTCTTAGSPGTWQEFGLVNGGGGQVTQTGGKANDVSLNKRRGEITMEATASIAAGAVASFTMLNTVIGANDNVIIHRKSGGTAASYRVWVDSVASGSCVICVENRTAGALAEAVKLQFTVLPGAIA